MSGNDSEIMTFGITPEETVDHPSHYRRNGVECVDVIDALELEFHEGCALKYIFRAGHKIDYPNEPYRDRMEDLEKAAWYLTDKVNRLRKRQLKESRELIILDEAENISNSEAKELSEEKIRMGVDLGIPESDKSVVVYKKEGKITKIVDMEEIEKQENMDFQQRPSELDSGDTMPEDPGEDDLNLEDTPLPPKRKTEKKKRKKV